MPIFNSCLKGCCYKKPVDLAPEPCLFRVNTLWHSKRPFWFTNKRAKWSSGWLDDNEI